MAKQLRKREVLEQRNQVAEAFLKRVNVGIGVIEQSRMHAKQQRMRQLVRDNVLREAGEYSHAWKLALRRRREVSEHQPPLRQVEVRVSLLEEMRKQPDPRAELAVLCSPLRAPTETALEDVDGAHRHRVEHLLPELRITVRGRQSVVCQQLRLVQVHWRVKAATGLVLVDDGNVFA